MPAPDAKGLEGKKAPAFTLADAAGKKHALGDYAGKNVILYFYPRDDSRGCTIEAMEFTRRRPDFDAIGARIIGISADSVADHDQFKEKHSLDVTLAADESHDAIDTYGVWVEKNRDGRTFMGIERATFLIDAEGRIARVWRNVAAPGHADDVLEAAKAL